MMRLTFLFFSALEAINIFSHLGSIFSLFFLYKNIIEEKGNLNFEKLQIIILVFAFCLIIFLFTSSITNFFKKNRDHWLLLQVRPHFLALNGRRTLRINFKALKRMLASVFLLSIFIIYFIYTKNQSFLCSILLFTIMSTLFMFNSKTIKFAFQHPRSLLQVYSLITIITLLLIFKFVFDEGANFIAEIVIIYCLRVFIVDYMRAILFFLVNAKNIQI